jgi:hypothetical protein
MADRPSLEMSTPMDPADSSAPGDATIVIPDYHAKDAKETVRCRGGSGPSAFSIVNRFCMARLHGRAGRLTAQNGGFRPGQFTIDEAIEAAGFGAPLSSLGPHAAALLHRLPMEPPSDSHRQGSSAAEGRAAAGKFQIAVLLMAGLCWMADAVRFFPRLPPASLFRRPRHTHGIRCTHWLNAKCALL